MTVSFSADFKNQLNGKNAVVIISPTVASSDYYIAATTADGFTVNTNSTALSFNWLAKAKVSITTNNTATHLNDVFYKEPINLDGNYPAVTDRTPKPQVQSELSVKTETERK